MDISFELLSSMSPKINKRQKPLKKAPTILALKRYFRKSMDVSNANNPMVNESVITIGSSSVCSSSEERSECLNETPIIISDSEKSFNNDKTPHKTTPVKVLHLRSNSFTPDKVETRLSQEKYTNIKLWVNEVNSVKQNLSLFSEVSTVFGDDNPGFRKPKTNIAASSTLVESNSRRFDELFKRNESSRSSGSITSSQNCAENKIKTSSNSVRGSSTDVNNMLISDSLITDDMDPINTPNNFTEDSLELNLNESLGSRLQNIRLKETVEPRDSPVNDDIDTCDSVECEDLLDSLYGSSWRERKEDILPSSEPRPKNPQKKPDKKVPNTERRVNKISNFCNNLEVQNEKSDSNLLKILQKARFQKALQSPWSENLKKICDSDTESDKSEENKLSPIKLNFEEAEFSDVENKSPASHSSDSHKKVQNKIIEPKGIATKKHKKVLKENHSNAGPPKSCTYSFLASLSGSVPREQCDISALIYKENFRQHKETLATKLFELYNENIFDSSILKDTPIEWSDRMTGTAGYCYCRKITRRTGAIERAVRIVLSNKVIDSADRLRDTLLHEMCHAATWIVNQVADGHGHFWKAWASRAMKTFPELPQIKTCHDYVINTKYTYKCTGCGYSIGRHTKSLDTRRKRCGYCLGTFEVLINKTSKKGETKSVPVTPKKPTGFALFVKENYATTKTPDLKHADVMKILGQKFSSLKVGQS